LEAAGLSPEAAEYYSRPEVKAAVERAEAFLAQPVDGADPAGDGGIAQRELAQGAFDSPGGTDE
jgi:hypothetical protein